MFPVSTLNCCPLFFKLLPPISDLDLPTGSQVAIYLAFSVYHTRLELLFLFSFTLFEAKNKSGHKMSVHDNFI